MFKLSSGKRAELLKFSSILILLTLFLSLLIWKIGSPEYVRGDTYDYVTIAKNLRAYGSYSLSSEGQYPTSYRFPGYPFFLFFFVNNWPDSAFLISLIQLIMTCGMVIGTFVIAYKCFGLGKKSVYPALLVAFDLTFIIYSRAILSDILATFFLIMSCLLLCFSSDKKPLIFLSGLLFALAVFTRPGHLAFLLVIFFFLNKSIIRKSYSLIFNLRNFCKYVLIFLMSLTLFFTIWIYRNYRNNGFLMISSFEGYGKTWLAYYIEKTINSDSFNDSEGYRQFLWQSYLKEHPQLKEQKLDFDNPLFENKDWIRYQKENYNAVLRKYPSVTKKIFLDCVRMIIKRSRKEMSFYIGNYNILSIWMSCHSVLVFLGLMGLLIRSNKKAISLFIAVCFSNFLMLYMNRPYSALRFSLPSSSFFYILSIIGLRSMFSIIKTWVLNKTRL